MSWLSFVLLLAFLSCCHATTRYHVLCFLFDGVPPPQGMIPCDGSTVPSGGKAGPAGAVAEAPRTYVEHGPYAARLCEGCHQRQTNRLILPKDELCLNCHVMDTVKRKVHGPLASGGCIECHNPHGSGYRFLLVADPREFCLHCHNTADLMKDEAHQGVDEACTVCHNAHASNNDYLLRDSPGTAFTRRKHAPELSTELRSDTSNTSKSTQTVAQDNGRKPEKTDEMKRIRAEAQENRKKSQGFEEVGNIRSRAPVNDRPDLKTQQDKPERFSRVE